MKRFPLALLALSSSVLIGAGQNQCQPKMPTPCYDDGCCRTYCLGPDNYAVNAPVNPLTCDGDWVVEVTGFYWNAHENGLEYGVENQQRNGSWVNEVGFIKQGGLYINSNLETPHFNWNFGFKIGVGYHPTCDGWDLGVIWTKYNGSADSYIEVEPTTDAIVTNAPENRILLSLWSVAHGNAVTSIGFARVTAIQTSWSLDLNLVDLELGRKFWNSKRLALRPFVGIRLASLKQNYEIQNKGGVFSSLSPSVSSVGRVVNDEIDMDNNFKGIGIRGGMNSTWNLGCGWGIFGNLALSLVYGRFNIDQDETIRQAAAPFSKQNLNQVEESFRATTQITDLELGVQWASLFCDCRYGFTAALGWEFHLFKDQNQLWRILPTTGGTLSGANTRTVNQTHGNLTTQGWTLKLTLDF